MRDRRVVHIDTVRVTAGVVPEPTLVEASLPAALRRSIERREAPSREPIDEVASQIALAIRSAMATEGTER